MNDHDFWDLLTKFGIHPDSATAIVSSHRGMSDHDLWDRLTANGAAPDAATQMVEARRPQANTDISARNIGRSLAQGATFGWLDEILGKMKGDSAEQQFRANDAAFANAHPVANFAARATGGVLAPAAAVAFGPEMLGTAGGAALLGAGTGALSGAGEANGDLGDRGIGAATGGLLGGLSGLAAYGLMKGGIGLGTKLFDRFNPERAVARAAANVLPANTAAKMAEVNAVAPGGASIATSAVPPEARVSQMLPMLRTAADNPEAAKAAEGSLVGQRNVLKAARKAIGAKMDALNGSLPVDPQAQAILDNAAEILGKKAPVVENGAVNIQDLRDGLSRLRYRERTAQIRGVDANGVDLKDITASRAALESWLRTKVAAFGPLDQQYAVASDATRQVNKAVTGLRSAMAQKAAGEPAASTAGSAIAHTSKVGILKGIIDEALTNKAGAADAVNRLIASPGGPEKVAELLAKVPKPRAVPKAVNPITAATIPGMRGLLFPQPNSP